MGRHFELGSYAPLAATNMGFIWQQYWGGNATKDTIVSPGCTYLIPKEIFTLLKHGDVKAGTRSYQTELDARWDLEEALLQYEATSVKSKYDPCYNSQFCWAFNTLYEQRDKIKDWRHILPAKLFAKLQGGCETLPGGTPSYYGSRSYQSKEQAILDLQQAEGALALAEQKPTLVTQSTHSKPDKGWDNQYFWVPDDLAVLLSSDPDISNNCRLPRKVYAKLSLGSKTKSGPWEWRSYPNEAQAFEDLSNALALIAAQEALALEAAVPSVPTVEESVPATTSGGTSMVSAMIKAVVFVLLAGFSLIGMTTTGVIIALIAQFITMTEVNAMLQGAIDNGTYYLTAMGGTSVLAAARAARPHIVASVRTWLIGVVQDQLQQRN